MSDQKQKKWELTDDEREALAGTMKAQIIQSHPVGFALRGSDRIANECLTTQIPGSPAGTVSVCGAKDFLIDEIREFPGPDGSPLSVRCASSAVLEMTDSPVHVHAATLEYYVVLAGQGQMVLGSGEGERVVPVQEGSVILLPPGQPHGIASADPRVPIKALLIFTPGLAPVDHPAYRDEQILHARTSQRLLKLQGLDPDLS